MRGLFEGNKPIAVLSTLGRREGVGKHGKERAILKTGWLFHSLVWGPHDGYKPTTEECWHGSLLPMFPSSLSSVLRSVNSLKSETDYTLRISPVRTWGWAVNEPWCGRA